MRLNRVAWIVVALGLVAAAPAYADVRVTLQDGRVSISAKDATVAEILAEWGRVADMTIVNADKLSRERMTIELQSVTELEALDILLRAMGGYIARPRIGGPPAASVIGSVMVMAPSAPIAPPPAVNARALTPPSLYVPPVKDAPPDGPEPAPAPARDQKAPVFSTTVGTATEVPEPVDDAAIAQPVIAQLPVPTREEEAATAVAQAAINSRRALETVNPLTFVLPKGGQAAQPIKR